MIVTSDHFSIMQLHAYIDGQLDGNGIELVEKYLDDNPEKLEELENFESIGQQIREFYSPIESEAIPTAMLNAMGVKQPSIWLSIRRSISNGLLNGLYIVKPVFQLVLQILKLEKMLNNEKAQNYFHKSLLLLQRFVQFTRINQLYVHLGIEEWYKDLRESFSLLSEEWRKSLKRRSLQVRLALSSVWSFVHSMTEKLLGMLFKICRIQAYRSELPVPEHNAEHGDSRVGANNIKLNLDTLRELSFKKAMLWLSVSAALGWGISHLVGIGLSYNTKASIEKNTLEAHRFFTTDGLDAVTGGVEDDERLIEELSAYIGHEVKTARLSKLGYEMQGAILLPEEERYSGYRLYQSRDKKLVSIYMTKNHEDVSASKVTCRMLNKKDSLCTWVIYSVRYTALSNLAFAKLQTFSRAAQLEMIK